MTGRVWRGAPRSSSARRRDGRQCEKERYKLFLRVRSVRSPMIPLYRVRREKTYIGLGAQAAEQALDHADLFQNDEPLALFALVVRDLQVLRLEHQPTSR